MSLKEYTSPVWGKVSWFIDKDNYITVYSRVDERRYKFYRRNGDMFSNDNLSPVEEDWSGYLIGGRSARFDWKLPEYLSEDDEIQMWIDSQIQAEYDDDGVPGFHVERVGMDEETTRWQSLDADELWAEYKAYSRIYKQALVWERESDRKKAQIFDVGRKFGWEY